MAFHVDILKEDAGSYRVILSGKLDTIASPELDRRMADVLRDPAARTIRMEISRLTFICSTALGSFATIRKTITANGGTMLTIAQPPIAKVFEILKMLPKETMCATGEEADAYLAALQKQAAEEMPQGGAAEPGAR